MSGLPYGKFFWNDWQGDPLLKLCSLAAQGLWMRMLCLAAESDKPGFVRVAGRPVEPADLAKMTGEGVETVTTLVAELERNQVFSRDRHGNIYCRRMIREQKKRKASAKGGKKGGPVTAEKHKGIHATRGPTRKATRGSTRHPESRVQSPEARKSNSEPKGSGGEATLFEEGKRSPPAAPATKVKPDLRAMLYSRGKEVLGLTSGGLITSLLKSVDGNLTKALAKLEDAAEKREPLSYLNAFLHAHGPPGIEVGLLEAP